MTGRPIEPAARLAQCPDCQIGAPRRVIESRSSSSPTDNTTPRAGALLLCGRGALGLFSPCPPHRPRLGQAKKAWGNIEGICELQQQSRWSLRFSASCATVTAHHSLLLHDSLSDTATVCHGMHREGFRTRALVHWRRREEEGVAMCIYY